MATIEKRIVVTQDNDFKRYKKIKSAGVLIIPPYLTTGQIDELLTDFISGKDPEDFKGKATKI